MDFISRSQASLTSAYTSGGNTGPYTHFALIIPKVRGDDLVYDEAVLTF